MVFSKPIIDDDDDDMINETASRKWKRNVDKNKLKGNKFLLMIIILNPTFDQKYRYTRLSFYEF